jgi:hypothetical protein
MNHMPSFISAEELARRAADGDLGRETISEAVEGYRDFLSMWGDLNRVIGAFPDDTRERLYARAADKLESLSLVGAGERVWPYERYEAFVLANHSRISSGSLTAAESAQVKACGSAYIPYYTLHRDPANARFRHENGLPRGGRFASLLSVELGTAIRSEESHQVLRRVYQECTCVDRFSLQLSAFVYNKNPAMDVLALLVGARLSDGSKIGWDVIGLIRFHHSDKIGEILRRLPAPLVSRAKSLFDQSRRESLGLTAAHAEAQKSRAS